MTPDDEAKLARLQEIIAGTGGMVVAFSGGADSTLLLAVAAQVLPPGRLLAVTAGGDFCPPEEAAEAAALAAELGVEHQVVQFHQLANAKLTRNPRDRCYQCKSLLLAGLRGLAEHRGLPVVAEGSQADDLAATNRPGVRALAETGSRSPLADAGLGKAEVRRISQEMGLPTWDRPARPCLATRFPYGTRLTAERLSRVAAAERYLGGLGFTDLRVRDHGGLARVEVPVAELPRLAASAAAVTAELRRLGFQHVTADLAGLRSGSMDE